MSLQGISTIVTGAGRGIGRAAALALAAEGAKVALLARTRSEIEDTARIITADGGSAEALACDVRDEAQIIKTFDTAEMRLGPVGTVINNAGVLKLKPLAETSLTEWHELIEVNLTGAFLVAREAMRRMADRGGCIINIGSMAGRRGYAEQGAYCSSKHGLVGLTKVMAIEGQPLGIRVHLVSPGGVHTDLSKDLRDSRGANSADWMTAEEVAEAILFCARQTGAAFTDDLVLRRERSEPWR